MHPYKNLIAAIVREVSLEVGGPHSTTTFDADEVISIAKRAITLALDEILAEIANAKKKS